MGNEHIDWSCLSDVSRMLYNSGYDGYARIVCAAADHIKKLEKQQTHCPDCGGDYIATGQPMVVDIGRQPMAGWILKRLILCIAGGTLIVFLVNWVLDCYITWVWA